MRKILDSPPIFGHYYVKRVYKVFDIKLTDYRVKNFKYPYCVIMSENRETMDNFSQFCKKISTVKYPYTLLL